MASSTKSHCPPSWRSFPTAVPRFYSQRRPISSHERGVAQAIALANFLLLMCHWVAPSDEARADFFSRVQVPTFSERITGRGAKKPADPAKKRPDGNQWQRRVFRTTILYVYVALGVAPLTDIAEHAAVYCYVSSLPAFAHLWLEIFHTSASPSPSAFLRRPARGMRPALVKSSASQSLYA